MRAVLVIRSSPSPPGRTSWGPNLPQEVCPVIGIEVTQPHSITVLTEEARTRLLLRPNPSRMSPSHGVSPSYWNVGSFTSITVLTKGRTLTLIETPHRGGRNWSMGSFSPTTLLYSQRVDPLTPSAQPFRMSGPLLSRISSTPQHYNSLSRQRLPPRAQPFPHEKLPRYWVGHST
ncbi:hypothetical protein AVEN_165626-1 [Araneus ventricosus]|uniref:Uncharacterized protein n=1 Tax=Araneus ventricosus TaxID=182803 RepID=A0A4Y2IIJ5_ARAVE|nr:hypothetical protein AVEN_165626-1 [Araneus ventricosus]